MKIWILSHECSGIAEAGGVKNVTFSLCKELQKKGHKTVLFIPFFGCINLSETRDFSKKIFETKISICGKEESVSYSRAFSREYGFEIIFVNHLCYSEKEAVYTYTQNEENQNPAHKKGSGHEDAKFKDILFCKAVNAFGSFIQEADIPDFIHCQDASTAVTPLFTDRNPLFAGTKNIVTIHNAGPAYHHEFSSVDEASWFTGFDIPEFRNSMNDERVEPFLIAVDSGASLTTVSPVYAEELLNPENNGITDGLAGLFASKNIPVLGITNGIDIEMYDPSDCKKSFLKYEFSPENKKLEGKYKNREYFLNLISNNDREILSGIKKYGFLDPDSGKNLFLVYQGRLASQKGLSLLADVLPETLRKNSFVKVIITGQGEKELEEKFISLAESEDFRGKVLLLNGYNKQAARFTVASGDFIVLPSYFEPCGLEDFIALLYGTLPVANRTGGLNKILDNETGFLYDGNSYDNLKNRIQDAIDLFKENPEKISEMTEKGAFHTRNEYSWDKVVENSYIPFFEKLLSEKSEKN